MGSLPTEAKILDGPGRHTLRGPTGASAGAAGARWPSRSSKPWRGGVPVPGGFDSHTLPPAFPSAAPSWGAVLLGWWPHGQREPRRRLGPQVEGTAAPGGQGGPLVQAQAHHPGDAPWAPQYRDPVP
jgi:hypothetical protein